MTLSTRINKTLAPRVQKAVTGVGVAPSDLVREGLSRVLAEYEQTGSVRFGVSQSAKAKPATRRTQKGAKAA